jgi:septal ring factor EnvC (AmiA/AmiB activator)
MYKRHDRCTVATQPALTIPPVPSTCALAAQAETRTAAAAARSTAAAALQQQAASLARHTAWVAALRHELCSESTLSATEADAAALTVAALKRDAVQLKAALRSERQHSARLELWAGALCGQVAQLQAAAAAAAAARLREKAADAVARGDARREVWRHRAALQVR